MDYNISQISFLYHTIQVLQTTVDTYLENNIEY